MGTAVAPTYANLMMGTIDTKIRQLAKDLHSVYDPILFFGRFIDDIFLIWTGDQNTLDIFLNEINNIHPTLKFTSSSSATTPSIPFLDTLVSIKNNKISTDLYRKPTDRCQYLLPSSCHPQHITRNIPFSLAYRLVRICSEKSTLITRLEELRELLLSRDYNPHIVQGALNRALSIPRQQALQKVDPTPNDRVVFVLDFHPALPSISSILRKSWKVMVKDPFMKNVFKNAPLVAYRKPRKSSLRDLLVKTKIPEPNNQRPRRDLKGVKKCHNSGCTTCPFMLETDKITSTASTFSFNVRQQLNCKSTNVVYRLTCQKSQCIGLQYIGETGRRFKDRLTEHVGYIRTANLEKPTGHHFNLPGHSLGDLEATIIEKCKFDSPIYRKTRESYFINVFASKYKGLNRKV